MSKIALKVQHSKQELKLERFIAILYLCFFSCNFIECVRMQRYIKKSRLLKVQTHSQYTPRGGKGGLVLVLDKFL